MSETLSLCESVVRSMQLYVDTLAYILYLISESDFWFRGIGSSESVANVCRDLMWEDADALTFTADYLLVTKRQTIVTVHIIASRMLHKFAFHPLFFLIVSMSHISGGRPDLFSLTKTY